MIRPKLGMRGRDKERESKNAEEPEADDGSPETDLIEIVNGHRSTTDAQNSENS